MRHRSCSLWRPGAWENGLKSAADAIRILLCLPAAVGFPSKDYFHSELNLA